MPQLLLHAAFNSISLSKFAEGLSFIALLLKAVLGRHVSAVLTSHRFRIASEFRNCTGLHVLLHEVSFESFCNWHVFFSLLGTVFVLSGVAAVQQHFSSYVAIDLSAVGAPAPASQQQTTCSFFFFFRFDFLSLERLLRFLLRSSQEQSSVVMVLLLLVFLQSHIDSKLIGCVTLSVVCWHGGLAAALQLQGLPQTTS